MDQMVSNYTCKWRTSRWSMILWYNMMDVAYAIFTTQHPGYMGSVKIACCLFIKELGKELVMPHMKRPMWGMPKHMLEAMGRCLLKPQTK